MLEVRFSAHSATGDRRTFEGRKLGRGGHTLEVATGMQPLFTLSHGEGFPATCSSTIYCHHKSKRDRLTTHIETSKIDSQNQPNFSPSEEAQTQGLSHA